MTAQQTKGVYLAVLTAIISGFSNYFNALAVKGIDPLVHNVVKNGLVGIAVLAVLLLSADRAAIKKLTNRQWLKLSLVAVIGGSIPFWLFFSGVKQIGAVEGSLIHKTLIFWVALMALPLLKERLNWKMWVGVALLYLSNFAAGFTGFKSLGGAHLMVLVATIMWAVENIVVKKTLKEVPTNIVVAARMAGGALILGGILVVSGKAPLLEKLTLNQWLMLAGVATLLFGYVMSWYRALKLAPATLVASVLVGATVMTTLIDAVLGTKALTLTSLTQAGMTVSGVYLSIIGFKRLAATGERATIFWKPKIS